MSLNSLQDDMSRRAASMASMAQRMQNPQEIQSMRQRLIAEIQSGAIKPYVGIPLVQELTQKLTAAQAQMAQTVAGAGMPPPQGNAPIAEQVMQQAAPPAPQPAPPSQGVETLSSNLPQSYAGGGIIAFEGGGEVERYQVGGAMGGGGSEIMSAAGTAAPYAGRNLLERLFSAPEDPEWKRKLREEQLIAQQAAKARPTVTPAAAGAQVAPTAADLGPVPGSTDRSVMGGQAFGAAPALGAPGAAPSIGNLGGYKPPVLAEMNLPTAPARVDYGSIIKDAPEKVKKVSEDAVTKAQEVYNSFTKPAEEARESGLQERKAAQEQDTAMGRALNLMSLGFGIAGSKERTLAGALGNEGRQGIQAIIQGEAANRAAKERLADARDNFEQQKAATRKGDYQAAQAAGNRAADDHRAGIQLAMTGAHYGNTEALQLFQTQQQGEFQKTSLDQSGKLGIAGLGLQAQGLAQTGAFQKASLAAQERRYGALDESSKARIMQATAKGLNDFMMNEGAALRSQLAKEYGPNFLTAKDTRSLEAQRVFNQRKQAYLADIKGQAIDALSARPSSDL